MSFLIAFLLLHCVFVITYANPGPNGLSRFCSVGLIFVFAWESVASLGALWGIAATIAVFGAVMPVGVFLLYLAATLFAKFVAVRQVPDESWETIGPAELLGDLFMVYREYLDFFVPVAASRS